MKNKSKFWIIAVAAIAFFCTITPTILAQTPINQAKLAINGIGPVRIGMTLAEAERSAKTKFVETGGRAGEGGCYYVRPQGGPAGLNFMVISPRRDQTINRDQDRIVRVDVFDNSRIQTLSGAKIGDSEARIQSLYGRQIRVSPHNYTGNQGGRYLTFVPKDASDRNYRLIFETLNNRVTQFRSGKIPEVEFVEGCA